MTSRDTPPDLVNLLCFGTYKLHRAFNRFYQAAFSDTGLTYPKFVILSALDEFGPLSVSELSARAGVEPQTLSPLLKKMQGFNTLTRTRAPEDERRVLIEITDLGQELLRRARKVVMEGFEDLGLDAKQTEAALAFLAEVRDRVEEVDPPKLYIKDVTG